MLINHHIETERRIEALADVETPEPRFARLKRALVPLAAIHYARHQLA